jgi:hypothetical protein
MKTSMVTLVILLVVTLAFWIGPAQARHGGGKGKAAGPHQPKGGARPGAGKAHPPQPKAKAHAKPAGGKSKAAGKKKHGAPHEKDDAKKSHDRHKDQTSAGKHADRSKELASKPKAQHKDAHSKESEKAKHRRKAPAAIGDGGGAAAGDDGSDGTGDDGGTAAGYDGGSAAGDGGAMGTSDGAGGGFKTESIAGLSAVHLKLQGANHNYRGNLQGAMRHIVAALETVGATPPPSIGTGKGRVNLPKPESDRILRDARASLDRIRNQLATDSQNGHLRGAVDKAIGELDMALNAR